MSGPGWVGEAEQRLGEVFNRISPMESADPPTNRVTRDPAYEVAEANLRWAIWCVESLYELRDLIDLDDARGDNVTPLGHRTNPVAMGHVMWACVTAIGALDRVAAAFGALHLDATPDARVHDFAQLYEHRREIKNCDPVRTWLRDVKADAAYKHVLGLLRDPMTHRTTPIALYGRAYLGSASPTWEQRPPHLDAPDFYIGTNRDRSIGVVALLAEVTPSTERHVKAALALVDSGDAFPVPS